MTVERTQEPITAVYVGSQQLMYVCQWRDEAGGYTCGRCGRGALGPIPKSEDSCKVCHAEVIYVRRGPPEPMVSREPFPW